MITVSILINGQPIYTRSSVNRLKEVGKYVQDDGKYIAHNPEDGAVALSIKMLKTIQENPDEVISKKERRKKPKTIPVLPGQTDLVETLSNRGMEGHSMSHIGTHHDDSDCCPCPCRKEARL